MKTHNLKIWQQRFDAVRNGTKTFDIRKDDRGFNVGDTVVLEEFRHGVGEYTGRKLSRVIRYIARGDDAESCGLKPGYCVLGITPPPA